MVGLLDLPYEVLLAIGGLLDSRSACRFGSTCRLLRRVIQDDFLWRQVAGSSSHDQRQKRLFTRYFNSHSWKAYCVWRHEKESRWKRGICDGYHLLGHTGRVLESVFGKMII